MIALVFFKFLIPTFSNSMHQLSPQKQYPSFMPRPPPRPPPPPTHPQKKKNNLLTVQVSPF